jgi:hypothetical protein
MRLPQEALLKTTFQQLGRVVCPQLLHHIGAVRLHSLGTNAQLLSNFVILEAIPNEIEDLLLPLRQGDNPTVLGFRNHILPPWA